MAFYKVRAIVIKVKPFAEADKLVTFFSKEKGKIQAVAKGARRGRSSFGGRLELFSYNDFFVAETKGLHILSQVESLESFYLLREDLDLLVMACYLIKMVDSVSALGQINFPLFRLLLWSLHLLKKGVEPSFVARIFEAKLSLLEGVFPVLDRCVKCGKKPKQELEEVNFSFSEGGIICSGCAKDFSVAKIPYEVVKLSKNLADYKFDFLADKKIEPELLNGMEGFLGAYLRDKFEIDGWKNCAISPN